VVSGACCACPILGAVTPALRRAFEGELDWTLDQAPDTEKRDASGQRVDEARLMRYHQPAMGAATTHAQAR